MAMPKFQSLLMSVCVVLLGYRGWRESLVGETSGACVKIFDSSCRSVIHKKVRARRNEYKCAPLAFISRLIVQELKLLVGRL